MHGSGPPYEIAPEERGRHLPSTPLVMKVTSIVYNPPFQKFLDPPMAFLTFWSFEIHLGQFWSFFLIRAYKKFPNIDKFAIFKDGFVQLFSFGVFKPDLCIEQNFRVHDYKMAFESA